MGGIKNFLKSPTQPLCRSVSRYNQARWSLSCSLHFVLFPPFSSASDSFAQFQVLRAHPTPSPPLSARALRLSRREAAPKAPRWRRRPSPGCSQSPPARGSHQLLSTSVDPLGEATRFLRVSPRG
uniref:Uncharacterized protein n=1 Tax=Myotis myotis TaxID=51298 RepID=A0A7J7Z5B1_MYOMY|nr:hypothetical protein mMyoMyo1_010606 [Myotis myotis]